MYFENISIFRYCNSFKINSENNYITKHFSYILLYSVIWWTNFGYYSYFSCEKICVFTYNDMILDTMWIQEQNRLQSSKKYYSKMSKNVTFLLTLPVVVHLRSITVNFSTNKQMLIQQSKFMLNLFNHGTILHPLSI